VNPDLEPFKRINPCGFERLPVTSLEQIDMLERVLGTADIADNKTAAVQVGDELSGIFQSLYLGTQASAACNE